jgi:hypothetical protein
MEDEWGAQLEPCVGKESAEGLREAIFEADAERDDFMVAFQIRRDSILSMLTTHVSSGYF